MWLQPERLVAVGEQGTENVACLCYFSSRVLMDVTKQKLSMKANARCVKLAVRKNPNSGSCNGLK